MADNIRAVLDAAAKLLQGEPLRAIGYGGAIVLWIIAGLSGRLPDMTFDEAIVRAAAAAAIVAAFVESARHYVSPVNG